MSGVKYQVRDRVARITLDEPETRNAMTATMQEGLVAAFRQAEASSDVSVILLTGSGDTFCAGGDLRLMKEFREKPATEIYTAARRSADLFKTMLALETPIVAAVNGPALGGGFGVVCSSALVVASEKAKFGCTELKIGLFPLVILPAIRRALGDRKALELSLLAELLDAPAALHAGIVNKVVAHDDLLDEAQVVADRIASFSPIAVRMGMRVFRDTTGASPDVAIEHLLAMRVVLCHTEDLHEGASAFLERRKPVWTGQ